jgi:imidazole glycerol-phosphate synthase subunit HisF
MFRPRIIPCLLLKNLGLVKTINFKEPRYIGDPMNAVKIFNDFEADELVFLDIHASKDERTLPLDFVKKVSEEAFMPFAVGGGIKSVEEVKEILSSGAEKVVINSHAIENPEFVRKVSDVVGRQSVIVSIDVKKEEGIYKVYTHNGTKDSGKNPVSIVREMEKMGAGEILINSIDKDGTMEGYDLTLIKSVSEAVSIPVVAAGGAGDLGDLKKAIDVGGASAASAGSIFVYNGKSRGILINYPDKSEIEEIFK